MSDRSRPWRRLAYRLPFRDILNPAWTAREMDDPAYAISAAHEILQENDLHRGWTLFHSLLTRV
jgi:hypothetical protein